ncbi:MAG: BamA/TamA family outer membrane protein [Deltaproteobacteria bacterium]|nr:BamA/TamA family outer membrane protein [Myxococcales bacterium]MDP3216308.1 BamA/TamA family outer membrane protein [Deltaproteobacteria bacterium]
MSGPVRFQHLSYLLAAALLVMGCPARFTPGRTIVSEVNLRGVQNVDSDDLRNRIATRETPLWPANRPRILRWWRWWWVDPAYLDSAALTRDQARVRRFYQARGYYDAHVSLPRVTDLGNARARIDIEVAEGEATRVADLRLRGCEPGDPEPLPARICNNIAAGLRTTIGSPFDEERFRFDRSFIFDSLREGGYATPTVIPHAAVDPETRRAWVEYTARSGPRSRFGVVTLRLSPSTAPFTGTHLPNGLPVSVIRSALNIDPNTRYSRRALVDGQQALFDLGVFGIARIEEAPRPGGVVDLNVTLSTARLWRARLGGGLEVDAVRSNIHLLGSYEHRNAFGNFRRFRAELRPLLYLVNPSSLFSSAQTNWVWGLSSIIELARPELFRRTLGLVSAQVEWAPEPLVPSVAFRRLLRVSAGLERSFTRRIHGAAYLRFTDLQYCPTELGDSCAALTNGTLQTDPLYSGLYYDQRYLHLEQNLTYDSRDDRARPTRGWFITGGLMESVRIPAISNFTFVRAQAEARTYLSPIRNFVFAFRAMLGGTIGDSYELNGQRYWPLPTDLRFVSGGSQSNRGYPFGRVGALGTVPLTQARGAAGDPLRTTALGGTAIVEGSFETRWQPGAFGMVAFLDVSNVIGIDPQPFVNPQGTQAPGCQPTATNAVPDGRGCVGQPSNLPPPRSFNLDAVGALFSNLHPSVGIGFRYLTPIGPLRADFAVRLNDLGCSRFDSDVAAQNAAAPSGFARYYVVTSPRCDFFGADIPLAIQLSLGEAY